MKILTKNIHIPALEDSLIKDSKLFLYIDSDFESYGASKPGKKSEPITIEVLEMTENATFKQMFTEKQALTQGQILHFIEHHKIELRTEGYATFFLFKSGEEFLVARVFFNDDGSLGVYVLRFESDDTWYASFRHRVVVPTDHSDTLTSDTLELRDLEALKERMSNIENWISSFGK